MRLKAVSTNTNQYGLDVEFYDGSITTVDLREWIETGGDILMSLRDPLIFKQFKIIDYGCALQWNDDEDLAIDAIHLSELSRNVHSQV